MVCSLMWGMDAYEVKTYEAGAEKVSCRAWFALPYCEQPAAEIQKLNLFAPEEYFRGGSVNGYTAQTAPIFVPNTVGGYRQGPEEEPGMGRMNRPNSVFRALQHGCVVASAGIRGSNTTVKDPEDGSVRRVGTAPALILDEKAVIRALRHNQARIPGNTERIITNGTSAGGALSALAGATGNIPEYEPLLAEMGAADERDDIFAASCYCPIQNLEHADSAYEWIFSGHDHFKESGILDQRRNSGMADPDWMTEEERELSVLLKEQLPPYINSLHLTDEEGRPLTLDESGEGSFKEYVKHFVVESADRERQNHDSEKNQKGLYVPGSEIDSQAYLTVEDGHVVDLDWDKFVEKLGRLKPAPAYDHPDLSSAENREFGTEDGTARHFTDFSVKHTKAEGEKAPEDIIRMMNPTSYLDRASVARHWRIRLGSFDMDSSMALQASLSLLLKRQGCDVDFRLPWGLPHSGDYDLDELFAWIDGLVKNS